MKHLTCGLWLMLAMIGPLAADNPAGVNKPLDNQTTATGNSPATPMKKENTTRNQPPSPVSVRKVKDNIYIATGGAGANTGFFVGGKSVLLIDSKMTTEASAELVNEIKKITAQPLKQMVLTHSDRDHVNGLAAFPAGMEIISHENTRKDMEKAFAEEPLKNLRPYLPAKTFTDSMNLDMDGEKVTLLYFGPAHTFGDTVVFFPAERTAFIGDLAFIGRDPIIHTEKGGNSAGLVHNLQSILKLEADLFVTGHSDVITKKEITALLNSIADKRGKIAQMAAQGQTLDEVKKAFDVTDQPPAPGRPRFPSLVEVIYQESVKK